MNLIRRLQMEKWLMADESKKVWLMTRNVIEITPSDPHGKKNLNNKSNNCKISVFSYFIRGECCTQSSGTAADSVFFFGFFVGVHNFPDPTIP